MMAVKQMKIFLSGATGMVGRNILEHPDAERYEILAPSRAELNLLDENAVKAFLAEHRPDLVIHAAGLVGGIQANIAAPVQFLSENLRVGLNVIDGAKQTRIPRLLNLGSSCMYPRNAQNPLREAAILSGELEPTNEGYALAKIACARLCDYVHKQDPSLSYKTIIPCNLYGRHDKFDGLKSHMIPAVIHKIHCAVAEKSPTVEVWGSGAVRREFMYASDLADFIFACLPRFVELPQYINVGLGHDLSILEYYQAVAGVVGYSGTFVHDLTKPEGMSQKVVDVSRLKTFGWQAPTSLEAGIAQTYNFYKSEIA